MAMYFLAGIIVGMVIVWLWRWPAKARHFLMMLFARRGSRKVGPSGIEDKLWHEEEANFVFTLHERLSSDIDYSVIARHVVEGVHNFLFVKKTVLLVCDNNSEQLRIAYGLGISGDMPGTFVLKKKEGIAGYALKDKMPLVVNDLPGEYFLRGLNKESYLEKSFVAIPLVFQNETLGLLYACDKKTGAPFAKKDIAFLSHVGKVAAIALKNATLHEQIQNDYLQTITTLAVAIDARDHYTERHSENVAKYALAIAEEINYPLGQREILRRAALLHDIGKIGIKDELLLKVGALTKEEFDQFKRHPEIGEHIVRSLPFLKEVAVFIRHHHERYDGNGYPDRISQNNIEWGARILSIADSFDAMASDRPYRKALSLESVVSQLKENKGSQFDPVIVDGFLKTIEKHPQLIARADV